MRDETNGDFDRDAVSFGVGYANEDLHTAMRLLKADADRLVWKVGLFHKADASEVCGDSRL